MEEGSSLLGSARDALERFITNILSVSEGFSVERLMFLEDFCREEDL